MGGYGPRSGLVNAQPFHDRANRIASLGPLCHEGVGHKARLCVDRVRALLEGHGRDQNEPTNERRKQVCEGVLQEQVQDVGVNSKVHADVETASAQQAHLLCCERIVKTFGLKL